MPSKLALIEIPSSKRLHQESEGRERTSGKHCLENMRGPCRLDVTAATVTPTICAQQSFMQKIFYPEETKNSGLHSPS